MQVSYVLILLLCASMFHYCLNGPYSNPITCVERGICRFRLDASTASGVVSSVCLAIWEAN